MQVAANTVVSIHYTLTNDAGETIDSSEGREPLAYLHGNSQIVPGLERELEGKSAGDRVQARVAPAEGYGEKIDAMVQEIPADAFQGVESVQEGMQFQAQTESGPLTVTVTKVEGNVVTVDGNHPLAGQTLNFDVEVVDIREASSEELEHGHAHGEGGHVH